MAAHPTNTPQDAIVRTGGAETVASAAPAGSQERKTSARTLKHKAPQPREQGGTLSTPGFPAPWSIVGAFALVVLAVLAAAIFGRG